MNQRNTEEGSLMEEERESQQDKTQYDGQQYFPVDRLQQDSPPKIHHGIGHNDTSVAEVNKPYGTEKGKHQIAAYTGMFTQKAKQIKRAAPHNSPENQIVGRQIIGNEIVHIL